MPRPGTTQATAKIAYEILRDHIIEGRFLPGQHVPAAELAEELQMSRTPIREALIMLEADGLVSGSHNRGHRVRPLSRDIISQLYELRAMLESFGVRKAAEQAENLSEDQRASLWAAMDDLEDLRNNRDTHSAEAIQRMMAANTFIHDTIIAASGNPQLGSLIKRTVDRGVIYRAFDLFSHDLLERANEFHRMILQRVVSGDAERAAALMAEHVFQSRDVVLEQIDLAGGDVSAVFYRPSADRPDAAAS